MIEIKVHDSPNGTGTYTLYVDGEEAMSWCDLGDGMEMAKETAEVVRKIREHDRHTFAWAAKFVTGADVIAAHDMTVLVIDARGKEPADE